MEITVLALIYTQIIFSYNFCWKYKIKTILLFFDGTPSRSRKLFVF